MQKILAVLVVDAFCLLSMGGVASAQYEGEGGARYGVQASYGDSDLGDGFGVGARATWALQDWHDGVAFTASFDYFFPSLDGFAGDLDYWELNGNLTYAFSAGDTFSPYLGGGLNFGRGSAEVEFFGFDDETTDSSIGLNLLGGLRFPRSDSRFTPFVEAKVVLGGDFEPVIITGGALF